MADLHGLTRTASTMVTAPEGPFVRDLDRSLSKRHAVLAPRGLAHCLESVDVPGQGPLRDYLWRPVDAENIESDCHGLEQRDRKGECRGAVLRLHPPSRPMAGWLSAWRFCGGLPGGRAGRRGSR
jgi:hypothetical protein